MKGPTGKKPHGVKQPMRTPARNRRFDAAHGRVPKPLHRIAGKDRPGDH